MKKLKFYSVVFIAVLGLALIQVPAADALKLAIVKPANSPNAGEVVNIIDFKNKDEAPSGKNFMPLGPTMPSNLNYSYNPVTLAITLSWDPSQDIGGDDSSILYEVYQTDGPPVLLDTVADTGYSMSILEIGRSYSFRVVAVNGGGLKSAANAIVADIPSYLDDLYFYENPNAAGAQKIELRWSVYPFIQKSFVESGARWHLVVFYLNREASPTHSFGGSVEDFWATELDSGIEIYYINCSIPTINTTGASLILPDTAESCSPNFGGVRNFAFKYANIGTDRLTVGVNSLALAASPTTQDYVTVAFYAFSGASTQTLVAVDKQKYYFQFSAPAP